MVVVPGLLRLASRITARFNRYTDN